MADRSVDSRENKENRPRGDRYPRSDRRESNDRRRHRSRSDRRDSHDRRRLRSRSRSRVRKSRSPTDRSDRSQRNDDSQKDKRSSRRSRSRSRERSANARYCTSCRRFGHNVDNCFYLHPELLEKRWLELAERNGRPPTYPSNNGAVAAMAQAQPQNLYPQNTGNVPLDRPPQGFALPAQLNSDTVWDYYDYAMFAWRDPEVAQTGSSLGIASVPEAMNAIVHSSAIPDPAYIQLWMPGQWLIDSGASNYFTAYKHVLSDFRTVPDVRIQTGNGFITGRGVGNVTLHTSLGLRKICDVLWVPDLAGRHNLLSIPQLIRKGCRIVMHGSKCRIFSSENSDAVELVAGSFNGKGFLLDMSVCNNSMHVVQRFQDSVLPCAPSGAIAMLAGTEDTQPIEIWHIRLGHLNQASIQQLVSRSTGMTIGPAKQQTISMCCESCLRGAQHKSISHMRSGKVTKRLQHVWTDIKGPLLEKDIYGFRYMVIFIDELTRWTEQYPMLARSDLFNIYKLYEARMERLSGEYVVHLHADGEYISNDFRLHLRNKGISLFLTQPYAQQMNSLAERMMRTIIEHASSMLWCAMLPVGFWSYATQCSVFLLNRSPASALPNNITPYEAWYGQKPNLGFLKVFGCRATAHVPDELRTKADWTAKSSPNCIFVGYSETENLFELWDVEKGVLLRKRDVVFWGHDMGHSLLRSSALPHGVSILPSTLQPVASAIVGSDNRQIQLPVPSSAPKNDLPLPPLPGRQSIDKLPSEPSTAQRAKSGDLTFIPYQPPANALNAQVQSANFEDTELYLFANSVDVDVFHTPSNLPTLSLPRFEADHLPKTYKQALQHARAAEWVIAMKSELEKLRVNDTWDLVPLPPGRKAFPNKWVYSWVSGVKVAEALEKSMRHKRGVLSPQDQQRITQIAQTSLIPKARLVARGDLQREGVDYDQTYAPVVKFVSLRVFLSYAASLKLHVRHWDIVSAFLHGDIDM